MKSKRVSGSFFLKRGRWFWSVRLPGEAKAKNRALIPGGSTEATRDWVAAQEIAQRLFKRATLDGAAEDSGFDGTVAGLVQQFMAHARTYYIDPETKEPSREVRDIKYGADLLLAECPQCKVDDFGPALFMAIRTKLVDTINEKKGKKAPVVRRVLKKGETFNPATMRRVYCRNYVNQQMSRIKRIFRWGVSSQLVSPSVDYALRAVSILKHDRTVARESERIRPVSQAVVEATLPYTTPTVADMLRLLLVTGMRPGEVCIMRGCDLTVDGDGWTYRPGKYKTKHLGIERVVPLSPSAVEIVQRRMKPNLSAYLFSPKASVSERHAAMRAAATVPSKRNRAKAEPAKTASDHYIEASLLRAVLYAIKKANNKGVKVPHWHPNQIRHLVATEVSASAGLDAARALLGHKSLGTTDIYAEVNMKKARHAANALDRTAG